MARSCILCLVIAACLVAVDLYIAITLAGWSGSSFIEVYLDFYFLKPAILIFLIGVIIEQWYHVQEKKKIQ